MLLRLVEGKGPCPRGVAPPVAPPLSHSSTLNLLAPPTAPPHPLPLCWLRLHGLYWIHPCFPNRAPLPVLAPPTPPPPTPLWWLRPRPCPIPLLAPPIAPTHPLFGSAHGSTPSLWAGSAHSASTSSTHASPSVAPPQLCWLHSQPHPTHPYTCMLAPPLAHSSALSLLAPPMAPPHLFPPSWLHPQSLYWLHPYLPTVVSPRASPAHLIPTCWLLSQPCPIPSGSAHSLTSAHPLWIGSSHSPAHHLQYAGSAHSPLYPT